MRLLLAAVTVCSAGFPSTTHAGRGDDAHVGIQLVDAPASSADDPRASRYIVDHVGPGTSIQRRIRVTNPSASSERVEVYAAAASVTGDQFIFATGRSGNEMTGWITTTPAVLDVPAAGSVEVTVAVDVPVGATSGEQYGVIWAEVAPAAGAQPAASVVQVYRAGVRVYLDVGPGGAPPTDFRITSVTAARGADGRPRVVAEIENTGGRTLDLSGSLQLADGPASQTAGPFAADAGVTVLAGDAAQVVVPLDPALPDGPWRAEVSLVSGITERTATAVLTFPARGAIPAIATSDDGGDHSSPPWLLIVLGILLALVAAAAWYLLHRNHQRLLRHA